MDEFEYTPWAVFCLLACVLWITTVFALIRREIKHTEKEENLRKIAGYAEQEMEKTWKRNRELNALLDNKYANGVRDVLDRLWTRGPYEGYEDYNRAHEILTKKSPEWLCGWIDTGMAIEEMMKVSHDTKKAYDYNKSEGTWSWGDKGEYDPENWHHGFGSFVEALRDAVEPYFDQDSEE